MRMLRDRVFTAILVLFIIISSPFFFIGSLLIRFFTTPFDRRLKLLHLYTSFWGALYTYVSPWWHIRFEGKKNADPKGTYVIVSNHQSNLDILVAFGLYIHYKWVSKEAIFKVPVIGWNMVLNRYVKLKRGDRESIAEMLNNSRQHLLEGSSVYFFPEGTRSATGEIKDFKWGAFELALETGRPILPIVIEGTRDALPKHTFRVQGSHDILLRILEPVPPEEFSSMSAEELAAHIKNIIGTELASIRQERKDAT